MPRATDAEIEESYERVHGTPDDKDLTLLEHVMWPNGRPKQGLHAKPEDYDPEGTAELLYGGGGLRYADDGHEIH